VRRATITISAELKRRLDMLRGERTWEEFLTELLNTAVDARMRELEEFLRETASKRDIPLERLELRLRGGDADSP
jgi:N-glycosylase/DNA lyase